MRKLLLIIMLLISACASPQPEATSIPATATIEPTATAVPTVSPTPAKIQVFNLISPDPIVANGESSDWDSRYTDPGAVIYHDGVFHMFRNGFRGFPATSQVGYVTSTDGKTWIEQNNGEPIFKSEEVDYAKIAIYASSVIVEDDGTWVMYFYTWDVGAYPISESVIGRATASAPEGPWKADAKPVLVNGSAGEWDENQVLAPHVIKNEDGYIMYYSGSDSKGKQQIGMATSSDGINWKKYNDPTTSQPFAESDPVLKPEEKKWDSGWVHQPRVFETNNGWVMMYRGTKTVDGQSMAIGIATSTDGIVWERFAENPVFSHRQINRAGYMWFHNALLVNDIYYLFIEGDINQTTNIYLATHEGALP
jgi:predicted GH43/DUF377 family glycosyl hydrolase